eukprot:m.1229262 g.1229262  ORF g.1229262 m.1229262 type:complete len:263 (-) comp24650_c0_seq6:3493-4281(-)
MSRKNEDLLGRALPDWKAAISPFDTDFGKVFKGRHVTVTPLDIDAHADGLFASFSKDTTEAIWDYIDGPFDDSRAYADWLRKKTAPRSALFFVVQDKHSKKYEGLVSYLRIVPAEGTIEVGNICLSPALQGTIGATEAMYLMMSWAFSAGYRRYEWKCNALNLKSRRAAQRLGFSYEGVFRQHRVQNGFNRDTAWFAIIDTEWPAVQRAFKTWLADENFDSDGQQRSSLSAATAPLVFAKDPVVVVEGLTLNPFARSTCGIQ